ncbi:MAG: DUF2207 family protein [Acidimicrobiales bacterium]
MAALAVVALVVVGQSSPAWAKSFGIESVTTDAVVVPDGSMTVSEDVTYDFDGTFNHLTRTFASGTITDLRASEGEQTLDLEQTGSPGVPWQWAIPNTSGRHTYTFSYKVLDAVRAGSDVGELNWQFIGTDTAVSIGHVSISIKVPGDGTGVRAWAHGPLNGVITVTANLVGLEVDHLPANTFVEAHVVDPIENFTMAPGPAPLLPGILAQEQLDADAANQARADARTRLERRHQLTVAMPFVVVAGLLGFVLIWFRWGREPRRPDDIGDYWREVPDDPPAVGRSLFDFGTVDSSAFSATVVDLAQRGYLRITEQRTDRLIGKDKVSYRFDAVLHHDADGLEPWERTVLQRLFPGVETSTQDDLTTWARANQREAQSFWRGFRASVKDEVERKGYLAGHRLPPFLIAFAVIVALIAFAVAMFSTGTLYGLVPIAAAFALFVFMRTLLQRTPAGARRAAEWDGLRTFLKDFSRLDEAVSGDLILYERYLVAAVALGVADELVRGLSLKVPEVVANPGFATWYVASSLDDDFGTGGLGGFGSFDSTFGATTGAFTPQSSGTGGGGGFSGGGGGGGGGGGFGAS